MGLLKKLFHIGVTAGATVAAVRVSDKVKENNPNGVGDVNGDGQVDVKDTFIEVKKAAKQVYQDAAASFNATVTGAPQPQPENDPQKPLE